VICTPVGDLPRLIAEYGVGLAAEESNPQSFGKALQQALSHSPRSFENNLRAAASAFDIDSSVLKFLEAINEA
jgi:glycosyltransferase involved in cell wall biosynthesis